MHAIETGFEAKDFCCFDSSNSAGEQIVSCCGTNTLVVGGRLWEDRPYSCPQHQDTFVFCSNVSAAIWMDPGRRQHNNSSHHEIVLPQSIPSCSITAASLTEHGVLLLQNEHRQDGVRFMSAEHQNESESLSIAELEKSKNTSLQRPLAKPEEESFQRVLPESAS